MSFANPKRLIVPMRNRLERIITILKLLSTGVSYNPIQLARETGANRRTIFRDIAALKSLGVPILVDDRTSVYSLAELKGGNEWLLGLVENHRTTDENGNVRSHNLLTPEGRHKFSNQLLAMLPVAVVDQLRLNLVRMSDETKESKKSMGDWLLELAAAIREAKLISLTVQKDFGKSKLLKATPKRIQLGSNAWQLMCIDSNNAEIWLDINGPQSGLNSECFFSFSTAHPDSLSAMLTIEHSASVKTNLSH